MVTNVDIPGPLIGQTTYNNLSQQFFYVFVWNIKSQFIALPCFHTKLWLCFKLPQADIEGITVPKDVPETITQWRKYEPYFILLQSSIYRGTQQEQADAFTEHFIIKPCVSREIDSAILTPAEDLLSAKDDLIGSVSDQPRGGPGIGDVVLKVCTLSSENKYQGF